MCIVKYDCLHLRNNKRCVTMTRGPPSAVGDDI